MDRDHKARLLGATVEVPPRTVYREFPGETVALNVESGSYFGLNETAARMLSALEQAGSVAGALRLLADQYDRAAEEIEDDLIEMCVQFEDQGLIVLRA